MNLPDYLHGKRVGPGGLKLIILFACVAAVALFFILREALREADDIYDKTGFIPHTTNTVPSPRP